MIDIRTEHLLSLPEAAAELRTRPHVATLQRWRLRGVRGVLLETVLIGGRRFTSREALQRFVDATTAATLGSPPLQNAGALPDRRCAAAEAELERDGI